MLRLSKETFGGAEHDDAHDINIKVEEEVGITCSSDTECWRESDDE